MGQAWELHEAGVSTAQVGRNLWPQLKDHKKQARRLINRARRVILGLPAFRSGRYKLPPYGNTTTLSTAAKDEARLSHPEPGEPAGDMVSGTGGHEA